MSTALDRRAEAAAAAVRAAVAHFEPGPDEVPDPGRRRWPVLAAAMVLVAAAIAGVVALRDDDGDTVVAGPTGALHLVPDDVPDGLTAVGATDELLPGSTTPAFTLYGRGNDDDPFAEGDVGILVTGAHGSGADGGPGPVRVRGVTGHAWDEGPGSLLSWDDPDVGLVTVESHSISRHRLVELANDMQRRGKELVPDPASGYRHIADLAGNPSGGIDLVIPARPGAVVAYQSEGSGDRRLTIAVVADSPGLLDTYRWLGAGGARRTTVRGHNGWLIHGSDLVGTATGIGWREGPGVLVTASGHGISDDDLRAAVESLRPATDSEWARLVAKGKANAEDDMPTLAQGPGWRYARDADDVVCFEVPIGGIASGTCGGDLHQAQPYEGAEQVDDGWWLHGRVSDEVRSVSVEVDGGQPEVVDTIPMSGTELRAWAVHVPLGSGRATIVTQDEKGAELERLPVDVPARIEPPQSSTTTTP